MKHEEPAPQQSGTRGLLPPISSRRRLGFLGFAGVCLFVFAAATYSVFLDCLARAILSFGAHCPAPAWWVLTTAATLSGVWWALGRAWNRWNASAVARSAMGAGVVAAVALWLFA